jgi:hypothetical protein
MLRPLVPPVVADAAMLNLCVHLAQLRQCDAALLNWNLRYECIWYYWSKGGWS